MWSSLLQKRTARIKRRRLKSSINNNVVIIKVMYAVGAMVLAGGRVS
jgi:hypothetical protein